MKSTKGDPPGSDRTMRNEIEQLIVADGFDDSVSPEHQAAVRQQMLDAFDKRITSEPQAATGSNNSQWLACCYAMAACVIAMVAIAWQARDVANNPTQAITQVSTDHRLQELFKDVEELHSEMPDEMLFEALDACSHQYAAMIQSEQSVTAVYFDSLHFPVN